MKVFSNVLVIVLNYVFSKLIIFKEKVSKTLPGCAGEGFQISS